MIFEYILAIVLTYIGIRYLVDMIKFAMGYEINGKKREPVFTMKRRAVPELVKAHAVSYEWEDQLKVG